MFIGRFVLDLVVALVFCSGMVRIGESGEFAGS